MLQKILAISLNVLRNYFDSSTKLLLLFFYLNPAKILDLSVKEI